MKYFDMLHLVFNLLDKETKKRYVFMTDDQSTSLMGLDLDSWTPEEVQKYLASKKCSKKLIEVKNDCKVDALDGELITVGVDEFISYEKENPLNGYEFIGMATSEGCGCIVFYAQNIQGFFTTFFYEE